MIFPQSTVRVFLISGISGLVLKVRLYNAFIVALTLLINSGLVWAPVSAGRMFLVFAIVEIPFLLLMINLSPVSYEASVLFR